VPIVAQGGSVTLNANVGHSNGNPADDAALTLTILDSLGDPVAGFPVAIPPIVRTDLGTYHYVWSVPALLALGDYTATWDATVDSADAGGSEQVEVVAPGTISTAGIFDLAAGKARLGITDTKDDALIQSFIDSITNTLQNIAGCWFQGDTADKVYYFDGNEARGGMVLPVPVGIQSVTTLELSTMTGGSYSVVPRNAYFLDPPRPDPGFPFTAISMSDQPMGWWYRFFPGKRTVKLTARLGWAAWPEDVKQIGYNVLIRLYRAKASGEGDVVGTNALGNAIVARRISPEERKMLNDVYGEGPAIG
jgi:hypothetical protein